MEWARTQAWVLTRIVRERNPAHVAFEAMFSIYSLVHEFLGTQLMPI